MNREQWEAEIADASSKGDIDRIIALQQQEPPKSAAEPPEADDEVTVDWTRQNIHRLLKRVVGEIDEMDLLGTGTATPFAAFKVLAELQLKFSPEETAVPPTIILAETIDPVPEPHNPDKLAELLRID